MRLSPSLTLSRETLESELTYDGASTSSIIFENGTVFGFA
jgi:hypothetical protein